MKLQYVNPNQTYLLAISGGVDSMVLANCFLLEQLKFSVAHCNFGLREEESDGDELLVSEWCEANNITLYKKKFDTIAFANQQVISIQEAARTLRYDYFNELKVQHSIDWIVTAHHQDDTIETLLFHFLRGTGIQGLTGIPQMRQGILRPLLDVSRQEIENYASLHKIEFRTDSSNKSEKYTRNKLRHSLIPLLVDIFPTFKQNMVANLKRFNEVNEVYQTCIQKDRLKFIEHRGQDWYIPIRKLVKAKPMQTILYELIKPFGFSNSQVEEVIKLMSANSGARLDGSSHRIIKDRNFLIVTSLKQEQTDLVLLESKINHVTFGAFYLHIQHDCSFPKLFAKDSATVYCDADVLEWPLILRKWRPGDYMYPFGMSKKKKVARILIDAKVPLHEKENIWVLESNKKIVWLIGFTADNRFRLNNANKNIIQFRFTQP